MELKTEEKKGFKRTDVGLIPEDWEVKSLGDLLVRSELGGNYSNSEELTENPLIKMGNLNRGSINLSKFEYIKNDDKVSEKHLLKKGDLLFNTRNTPQLVGKIAIWRNELKRAYYNSNLLKLEFDPNYIYSNFFMNYLLNTEYFIEKLSSIATGTTSVAAIYTRDLYKLNVPVPPPEEQQAIASALSDVDKLIRSLDGLIQKKEAIKKGTMQQLLTGIKRLPGFDGEWEVKRLGEIGITINGLSGKTKSDFGNGNHPYITFMNVMSNTVIDTSIFDTVKVRRGESQSEIKKGDLLFNTSSETPEEVGMCSVLLENVENLHLNSFCFGYRIHEQDEVLPLFLAYYFRSEFGRKHMQALAQGSTRYNLSKSKFVKIEIELPTYEEQKAITQILSDMDRELQTLRQKREKYVQIKQGMMQELLTGRVRLV